MRFFLECCFTKKENLLATQMATGMGFVHGASVLAFLANMVVRDGNSASGHWKIMSMRKKFA